MVSRLKYVTKRLISREPFGFFLFHSFFSYKYDTVIVMNEDQQNNAPTGGSQGNFVPPPPKEPEIKMRTMDSDVKSVEESGGGIPEPEVVKPSELDKGGPIFTPDTTTPKDTTPLPVTEVKEISKMKPWLLWTIISVLVVVVGFALYYYVWPLVFPTEPVVTEEVAATSDAEVTLIAHISAFGFSSGDISQLNISNYSLVSILTAVQNEGSQLLTSLEDNGLREISFNVNGETARASEYLSAILPELSGTNLEATLGTVFEDDFTAYLFKEADQVWPGYVVKLRSDVDVDRVSLNAQLTELENTSLSNLYLSPPTGDLAQFNTGPINNKYTSRYAAYSEKPASLNYGMFGDYLIISTTFKGLLKAISLLGL